MTVAELITRLYALDDQHARIVIVADECCSECWPGEIEAKTNVYSADRETYYVIKAG